MAPFDYSRARRVLMRRDPVLGAVIRQVGACGLAGHQHSDPLNAIVSSIVSQQLSGKAAATIFSRVLALMPGGRVSVDLLASLDEKALREAGLSRQKIGYLRDLSLHITNGSLELGRLDALTDDEVIAQLTAVKGIGRWTAEMFLMFRLGRPDVLPVGDLGIVTGVQRLYKLRKRPNAARLTAIGEVWRPYRSIACWYLWHIPRT
jgi:DNA-3-methyladenine glycosylase II